jgi:BirA family biotin operon repressor/biotin-[acetyl-CoA-carboxylase] ligase
VSKHVRALRDRGCAIEAAQNRGYRLTREPDLLDPSLVDLPKPPTRWLGRDLRFVREATSTNDLVSELAAAGAAHGTVVVADQQTSGRGRLGRSWHSPAGENLYLSLLLRPELRPSQAPPLSLATGVAVAEALAESLTAPPTVKWPNDLMCSGRKVAGILVEMNAELDRIRHVIIGVGVNVNTQQFPRTLRQLATSMAIEQGAPLSRVEVLAALLPQLELWIDRLIEQGPAPVIKRWLHFADWLGQGVQVRTGKQVIEGVAVGLDPTGALMLVDRRGRQRTIVAGDVSLVGPTNR